MASKSESIQLFLDTQLHSLCENFTFFARTEIKYSYRICQYFETSRNVCPEKLLEGARSQVVTSRLFYKIRLAEL
jgi:hypothetical protein